MLWFCDQGGLLVVSCLATPGKGFAQASAHDSLELDRVVRSQGQYVPGRPRGL